MKIKKETLEFTLDVLDYGVISTDQNGFVRYMNDAACRITQWSKKEGLGKSLDTVLHIVNDQQDERIRCSCVGSEKENTVVKFSQQEELVTKGGQKIAVAGSIKYIASVSKFGLGCVAMFSDVTQGRQHEREMQWHATHDLLTGLPNRALLADRFKQALFSAKRHKNLLAVCVLDLDDFKPVNDSYGHEVGDELLIAVAARLKQSIRQDDTVARLGGDEFVILMGDINDKNELHQALLRLRTLISEPYLVNGINVDISCSIGVALYPEEDVDTDTLLRHADQAMFVAKQAGRNRIHWFDVEEERQFNSSQQVLERVEEALLENELELYYQPKVNMRNGEILGMEALLRWNHPEKGLVSPIDFLPIIEQEDLIIDIGEWVIDKALEQQLLWQQSGKDWSVSVNIAAKHFHLPVFYSRLKGLLLKHSGVPSKKLDIEILESVALGDIQHVHSLIVDCQKLGVKFALDDFGTGYSSLSYLKRLPAETLKIDQTFIRDILDDQDDLALVQAIISLAKTFNREVVAEGVESVEHGVLLMRLGCDVAQGFGIARPMPVEHVIDWADQFTVDPKWVAWSSWSWGLNAFPLLVAQYDVREWVQNVIERIENETLPVPEARLTDECECRFGRWYKTDGFARYGTLEGLQKIAPIHHNLHIVGNEIISLYQQGEKQAARDKCAQLYELKDEFISLLEVLQLAVLSKSE